MPVGTEVRACCRSLPHSGTVSGRQAKAEKADIGDIRSRLGFADRQQQDGFGIPTEGPTIVMNLFSDLVKFLSDHCLH